MRRFAEACERVASTTKRLEKVALLAELLRGYPPGDARAAAIFLCGRPFAASDERTLNVGPTLLWRAVLDVTKVSEDELRAAYRRFGDLGAAAAEVWPATRGLDRSPSDLARELAELALVKRAPERLRQVTAILAGCGPLEAKYIVKILTSELRIGSKESLVHEAIATACDVPIGAVHRADMLMGDAGRTLDLAREGRLAEAELHLFHAVAPMLASPAASGEDARARIPDGIVEDKLDGIRAGAHIGRGTSRLFSRTGDDVTRSFPEIAESLTRFRGELVLDGELLAWRDGRALPFSTLQRRLGRKTPTAALMAEVPVAFAAFDILYADRLLLDEPLHVRRAILEERFADRGPPVLARAPQLTLFAPAGAGSAADLVFPTVTTRLASSSIDELFLAARARGNEGLMIKDPLSLYTPGRRGKGWLKWKRELATLDVVVTAVELGHGKRAGVLSDYTFAVRDGDQLVTIGKAYTGLTDVEIAELTRFFEQHTIEERGHLRVVEPTQVIEVAFNNMMETKRHPSGLALRFPRIVRLRPDKTVEDIDTLETARAIFASQV